MTEIAATKIQTPCANHLLKQLQEEFKVFGEYQPLAIGIDKQLLECHPEINRRQLRAALATHTHSVRYLKSMQEATHCVNLDGVPVGKVSDEQRAWASRDLSERFKKHRDRKVVQVVRDRTEKYLRAEREQLEKIQLLVARFSLR